jgi:amino-acid N-acetyltransferase
VAFQCESARPHDLGRALELLRQDHLPEHGVVEQFGHYLVVRNLGQLIGVCGLEVHGPYGLVRSLVIDPGFRRQGVGDCLVRGILDLGQKLNLRGLYLLTTTAQTYFERFGFHPAARAEAPSELQDAWELKAGCPTSAVLMQRTL